MKKTTTVGALALALMCAGPALAESYRAIQGSATNVIYVVPESLKKTGTKAETSVVAILENPRPSGMLAQELVFAIDCDARTLQQTATIDLDASRKELARRAVNSAAAKADKGSMGDTVINYACNGKFADDKVTVFPTFQDAVAGTKAYLVANRTPPKP